jgi:hypothetical protein
MAVRLTDFLYSHPLESVNNSTRNSLQATADVIDDLPAKKSEIRESVSSSAKGEKEIVKAAYQAVDYGPVPDIPDGMK